MERKSRDVWDKTYVGSNEFATFSDIQSDLSAALLGAGVPPSFRGKIRVTISHEPAEVFYIEYDTETHKAQERGPFATYKDADAAVLDVFAIGASNVFIVRRLVP